MKSETKFLQELVLYAASAAFSCLVLFAGLRHLDPNREASKKALEQKKEIAKRLGRPLIQTNSYEDVIACDVINPDHIEVEFDSIGGLETIKQSLFELVILPLRRPELFSHGKLLGPQKGVLLYGPPGTGKTMLAKAIAKESGAVFINVRIANLMSKWFGDAQKLVSAVFSLAYKLQPAIIFIDEVDSFLGQRRSTDHEALTNMKTEFMALWDGFTTDQNARVMVLAATNRPSELDEAILRRLPQAFEIGIPDRRERVEILKVVLKGERVENSIDFDHIAGLCDGYTGSDILELCKQAAYFPIRDLLNAEKSGVSSSEPRPLSQLDLEKVLAKSKRTFALVLVPTHELCMQVYELLQKLLHRYYWIVPGYIMGGESRSKEKSRLRKGVSILIATPGRLLDHLKNTSAFIHTNLRWLIFDEADRILELGFGKEIEEILTILGSRQNNGGESGVQRQNLLLSATLNDKVNHLSNISLENPVTIGLDDKKVQPKPSHEINGSLKSDVEVALDCSGKLTNPSNGEYKLPAQLVQRYVKVSCGSRLVVLISILKKLFDGSASQKIVVFFSTCDAVDFHYSLLSEFQWPPNSPPEAECKLFLGCKTYRLHGNMNHEDRRTTFNAFKTEKSALLLSTDVSARGLDFPKVRCIIQYDSPGEATEYVHRVGRTARLGERGDSLLFLQPVEIDYLQDLERHGVLLTEYPLLKLLDSLPLYGHNQHVKKFISLEMHPWVLSLQKALESFIYREPSVKKLAMNAFCSWVRAYSAHRGELKSIFMVKKLHLGHVARSFALKEQPSLVGKSFQKQTKKRSRDQKQKGGSNKKRRVVSKT